MDNAGLDRFAVRMFRQIFIPVLISSIGLTMADMADAIVVGQRMGATGLAAISLAMPIYMAVNVIAFGLGIGGSVKFSKRMGKGDEQSAVNGFSQVLEVGVLGSAVLGILGVVCLPAVLSVLGVSPEDGLLYETCGAYIRILMLGLPMLVCSYILDYYLRNDNNVKLASLASILGNVSDLILNIVLVLVLDMGAEGAACSTVLGQLLVILVCLPGLGKKRHSLKFCLQPIRWREVWDSFWTGFSTSVEHIWHLIFLLIVNRTLMYYNGETGMAVFNMVQNASFLLVNIYSSAVKAMQPLVGNYSGENNESAIRAALRLGINWGSAAGFASVVLLFTFPHAVCWVFGVESAEILAFSVSAIRIFCVGGLIGGINLLTEGYYQARGMERIAFVVTSLRGAVILIPCAILLSPLGMPYIWLMYPITELITLIAVQTLRVVRKDSGFDTERVFSQIIRSRQEDLGRLLPMIEEFCDKWNAGAMQVYYANMVVEEICVAIIQKGFQEGEEDYLQMTLIALEDGDFEFHIRYHIESYNPLAMESGRLGEENFNEDAMGIMVIKQQAKDFFYREFQGFNTLTVRI